MSYDYFCNHAKKALHYGIELGFPRTGTIATISGCVGWLAYQSSMTHTAAIIAHGVGKWVADCWFVPTVLYNPVYGLVTYVFAPSGGSYYAGLYFSEKIAFGAAYTTSLTLNLIAGRYFGIKANNDHPLPLPEVLKAREGIQTLPPKEIEPNEIHVGNAKEKLSEKHTSSKATKKTTVADSNDIQKDGERDVAVETQDSVEETNNSTRQRHSQENLEAFGEIDLFGQETSSNETLEFEDAPSPCCWC